jgi:hypothetical protein
MEKRHSGPKNPNTPYRKKTERYRYRMMMEAEARKKNPLVPSKPTRKRKAVRKHVAGKK